MIHYVTTTGIGNAWVANELRIVQTAGVPFVLHGMRGPQQMFFKSDWAADLARGTRVIYPLPVWGTMAAVATAPWVHGRRFFAAAWNAMFGSRESLRTRLSCLAHFVVACYWTRVIDPRTVDHIHAQWAHSSGSIAMYAAWLLGKSFSFTGHAADLFRERCALRDKIRRADFIVCISEFHRQFFLKNGARPDQLKTVYCGIDLEHFVPRSRPRPADGVIRIRSAGRLIEKKGFAYLIDACRILADKGVVFECVIGGDGPLEADLQSQINGLGLQKQVRLTGEALKQEHIPEFMHGGDLFCLPCVWARDGDVDGLPQMLMEAMASGLPAISTRLVGIPDLIIDGETGLLVEPHNTQELARAIERLGRDRELAVRLADAGRDHVRVRFDITTCLEPLIAAYRDRLGRPTGCSGRAPRLSESVK
jgi:glycosyltransferase involved in cell wall biosynthesis